MCGNIQCMCPPARPASDSLSLLPTPPFCSSSLFPHVSSRPPPSFPRLGRKGAAERSAARRAPDLRIRRYGSERDDDNEMRDREGEKGRERVRGKRVEGERKSRARVLEDEEGFIDKRMTSGRYTPTPWRSTSSSLSGHTGTAAGHTIPRGAGRVQYVGSCQA